MSNTTKIQGLIKEFNTPLDPDAESTAIILAAGHGKRIKSQRSKMLHKIWGRTTVERVSHAAMVGLNYANICVVVGIKARDVIQTVGKAEHQVFAYQHEQKGTGHAVQKALEVLPDFVRNQHIYVFPGDIGLLRPTTVGQFREVFLAEQADMMVLTGMYDGDPMENYYGRIVREPVKESDHRGDNQNKVIQIMENKDIHSIEDEQSYSVNFRNQNYSFAKPQLINIQEFNTGVFAFRGGPLYQYITYLDEDNAQGELYVTDLIKIFNDHDQVVKAAPADDTQEVLGFNNKSVLKQMNSICQQNIYEQLKDIINFRDPDDFFISENLVDQLLEKDKRGETLDIRIGKSVYINGNIEIASGVDIKDGAHITGDVRLGKDVVIHKGVEISTYPGQTLTIGENSIIFQDNIIKGNTTIGKCCRIESGVNITGSDNYPTEIEDHVMIKGTSYIFGSTIEKNTWIEHCVLKTMRVHCHCGRDGEVVPIRYVIPQPEGLDNVESIGDDREEYVWPPSD